MRRRLGTTGLGIVVAGVIAAGALAAAVTVAASALSVSSKSLSTGSCTLNTVTQGSDAYTQQDQATKATAGSTTTIVDTTTSKVNYAWLQFNLAQCSGLTGDAQVTSARLTLSIKSTQTNLGTRTLQLDPGAASWTDTTITWNNQPTVTSRSPAVTFSVGAAGSVQIDVTQDLASWRSTATYGGSANYGWRIADLGSGSGTCCQTQINALDNGTASVRPSLLINYAG